jgi:SAM-dependent methyltransferase
MTVASATKPTRRVPEPGDRRASIIPPAGGSDWSRDRFRLLSHIGRWGRARRWLPKDAIRVLDIGCGFGYGTVAIASRWKPPRWIAGVEYDVANVELAHRTYPWLPMVRGDATTLPMPDESIDAVVILDVLEHLADPETVLAEVHRVLRRDGCLIVSVPHRGLLTALDSNNAYSWLHARWKSSLPLEPCEESANGEHRHFSLEDARAVIGPGFVVDRAARTGLGLAELLHLTLLVALKGLLRWRGLYLALRHIYFAIYLFEDLIPTGLLGYNLTVRARRLDDAPHRPSDAREAVSLGRGTKS